MWHGVLAPRSAGFSCAVNSLLIALQVSWRGVASSPMSCSTGVHGKEQLRKKGLVQRGRMKQLWRCKVLSFTVKNLA